MLDLQVLATVSVGNSYVKTLQYRLTEKTRPRELRREISIKKTRQILPAGSFRLIKVISFFQGKMLIKCQTEFKLKKDSIIRFDDKPLIRFFLIRFLIVFYYPSTGDSPVESLETLEL